LEFLSTLPAFHACAMCLGGASGEVALAANYAIGLLLVVLTFILGSFGGFIYYLRKRSSEVAMEDFVEIGRG